MTSKAYHFLTNIGPIGKVSHFLGQPSGIDFNDLPAAVQQFRNSLLQSKPIGISQTGCGILDRWYERFDFAQSLLQLGAKSLAFLLAHLLEFIKSQINRFVDSCDHSLINTVARRLECAWNSSQHIDIQLTANRKILLHLFKRTDVARNKWSIQFVRNLSGSVQTNSRVYTTTRQPRANTALNRRLERGQFRTNPQVNIEK